MKLVVDAQRHRLLARQLSPPEAGIDPSLLLKNLVHSGISDPTPGDVAQVSTLDWLSSQSHTDKEGLDGDLVQALALLASPCTKGFVQKRGNIADRVLHTGSVGGPCLHVKTESIA